MADEPNFLASAFKSQYNLIGLGTALGFAVLSGSWLPLLIAAGVEMVVLPFVSGNERYQRLVRARSSEQAVEEREERAQAKLVELLRGLPDAERARYRQLELLAQEIHHNYENMDASSRMLADELTGKLDGLLSFYLRMRHSLARYDRYFATTDPERIQERIVMLEHEIRDGPPKVKEVKTRTKAVLEKRLDRYTKAHENRQLVDAQTETVQEVLQLLRDQSYSMRDPRSITEQLDGLLSSAEETERGVRDLDELLSLEQDALGTNDLDDDLLTLAPERPEARPVPRPVVALPPPVRQAPPPPPPPPRKKITH